MNARTLALHVLRALAVAQRSGRIIDLETLSKEIGVRRTDVRRAVSALHRQGYVDALRMRLSLAGFALGASLARAELPALRVAREGGAAAAA